MNSPAAVAYSDDGLLLSLLLSLLLLEGSLLASLLVSDFGVVDSLFVSLWSLFFSACESLLGDLRLSVMYHPEPLKIIPAG